MRGRNVGLVLLDAVNAVRRWAWYARAEFSGEGEATGPARPRLFVDVSLLALRDSGTGIQRVAGSYWKQLCRLAGDEFDAVPVLARPSHGYCALPVDEHRRFRPDAVDRAEPIRPGPGDHFLGLDLSAHLLPRHERQLKAWRRRGVQISIVVYDLLPITNPAFFSRRMRRHFGDWLGTIVRNADRLLAISDSVADQLARHCGSELSRRTRRIHLSLDSLPHAEAGPCVDLPNSPYLLMVGTIEPRKGYEEALAAFDELWRRGGDTSLAIVGRVGWHVEPLVERLRSHPEAGRRLRWFADADDATLAAVYRGSFGLLMLSHAEGFCLPVAEASALGKPVLARDLPVLREHVADVSFVTDTDPAALAAAIETFIDSPHEARTPDKRRDWQAGALELVNELGLRQAARPVIADTAAR